MPVSAILVPVVSSEPLEVVDLAASAQDARVLRAEIVAAIGASASAPLFSAPLTDNAVVYWVSRFTDEINERAVKFARIHDIRGDAVVFLTDGPSTLDLPTLKARIDQCQWRPRRPTAGTAASQPSSPPPPPSPSHCSSCQCTGGGLPGHAVLRTGAALGLTHESSGESSEESVGGAFIGILPGDPASPEKKSEGRHGKASHRLSPSPEPPSNKRHEPCPVCGDATPGGSPGSPRGSPQETLGTVSPGAPARMPAAARALDFSAGAPVASPAQGSGQTFTQVGFAGGVPPTPSELPLSSAERVAGTSLGGQEGVCTKGAPPSIGRVCCGCIPGRAGKGDSKGRGARLASPKAQPGRGSEGAGEAQSCDAGRGNGPDGGANLLERAPYLHGPSAPLSAPPPASTGGPALPGPLTASTGALSGVSPASTGAGSLGGAARGLGYTFGYTGSTPGVSTPVDAVHTQGEAQTGGAEGHVGGKVLEGSAEGTAQGNALWDELPTDSLLHVFGSLSFLDLHACVRVSRRWRQVILEDEELLANAPIDRKPKPLPSAFDLKPQPLAASPPASFSSWFSSFSSSASASASSSSSSSASSLSPSESGAPPSAARLQWMHPSLRFKICYRHIPVLLAQAAEAGNVAAMVWYADLLEAQGGGGAHQRKALEWRKKAARRGQQMCQYLVGMAYYRGDGELPRDGEEALSWLLRCVKNPDNDPLISGAAALLLGYMYLDGEGTERADVSEAIKWLTMARDSGSREAEETVGWLWNTGQY